MAEGEGEGAAPEAEKKKGGAKKLLIKIVPLVLIAFVAVKLTVLKPQPPSAAQVAARATAAKLELDTKCALANDLTPPIAPATDGATAPTGPTLDLDSKTMNLDGSHFLKVGVSLQLPDKSVPDDVKVTENWGSIVSQLVIDTFSGRSFAELSKDGVREGLQHQIGNETCEKTAGNVTTVYFIDFVMQ